MLSGLINMIKTLFENKLIQMNKMMLAKLDKNDWKSDYILCEMLTGYEI